jgi:hypothetical protein
LEDSERSALAGLSLSADITVADSVPKLLLQECSLVQLMEGIEEL